MDALGHGKSGGNRAKHVPETWFNEVEKTRDQYIIANRNDYIKICCNSHPKSLRNEHQAATGLISWWTPHILDDFCGSCCQLPSFHVFSGWWFQRLFIFIPIWGNDPIWLIFFKWVETTNQFCFLFFKHGYIAHRKCLHMSTQPLDGRGVLDPCVLAVWHHSIWPSQCCGVCATWLRSANELDAWVWQVSEGCDISSYNDLKPTRVDNAMPWRGLYQKKSW